MAPVLFSGSAAHALDVEQLYLKTAPSSVVVVASVRNNDGTTTESTGGGILIDGGYVLTTCDVLGIDGKPADKAQLVLGDKLSEGMVRAGTQVESKMIRCDEQRNLALLKPVSPIKGRRLKLAKSSSRPGTPVVAVGPTRNGFPWAVQECRVSGLGRPRTHSAELLGPIATPPGELQNALVLDVACMGGHPLFGSAIVDRSGHVVGVHQFTRFDPANEAGTIRNFYVAASEIRAFLDE